MVAVRSFAVAAGATPLALSALADAIDAAAMTDASLVCVFYDCVHDDRAIGAFVRERFPGAAMMGGSSCGGVMSEAGLAGPGSIGLLVVDDPDGDYGTAAVPLRGDIAGCAEQALHAALARADCAGELPELIWIYQAPGQEEEVVEGLRRVVGDRCPIIGGSSADNAVAGDWRQMGPDGPLRDGLAVGVVFSSGGTGFAFQGGYEPSGESGIITRVGFGPDGSSGIVTRSQRRELITIDGEPAAEVYNRWVGGILANKLATGGNVLVDTTMFPIGIDAGKVEGITSYLLVHPERILPGGGLSTFAEVREGTRVFSMRGDRSRLVERAGRVAAMAAAALPDGPDGLAGGLVVYCAGCMLAVGDEMPKVSQAVRGSFGAKPFVGCFTFGEQGAMLNRNAHGNLMISAVAFGK